MTKQKTTEKKHAAKGDAQVIKMRGRETQNEENDGEVFSDQQMIRTTAKMLEQIGDIVLYQHTPVINELLGDILRVKHFLFFQFVGADSEMTTEQKESLAMNLGLDLGEMCCDECQQKLKDQGVKK